MLDPRTHQMPDHFLESHHISQFIMNFNDKFKFFTRSQFHVSTWRLWMSSKQRFFSSSSTTHWIQLFSRAFCIHIYFLVSLFDFDYDGNLEWIQFKHDRLMDFIWSWMVSCLISERNENVQCKHDGQKISNLKPASNSWAIPIPKQIIVNNDQTKKTNTLSNSIDKRWKNIELKTAKTEREKKCTEQKKEYIYTQFTNY